VGDEAAATNDADELAKASTAEETRNSGYISLSTLYRNPTATGSGIFAN
jgi:hypothetical protein